MGQSCQRSDTKRELQQLPVEIKRGKKASNEKCGARKTKDRKTEFN